MSEPPPVLEKNKLFALTLDYKCPYKWSEMKGDDLMRHCGSCKQNVYNISKLDRDEAVKLISEREGEVCVRFYQRRDGTVVTRECFSIFGTDAAKVKFPLLAWINMSLSAAILAIVPIFAPAMVSVVQGVGPEMANSRETEPVPAVHIPEPPIDSATKKLQAPNKAVAGKGGKGRR